MCSGGSFHSVMSPRVGLRNERHDYSADTNSTVIELLSEFFAHLDNSKKKELASLIGQFPGISNYSSLTHWVEVDIDDEEAVSIRQHPFWVSPLKKQALNEEVE